MAKKGKGFWGAVGSFFGSIPVVKSVKKAGKSLKKKIKKAKSKLKLKNLFKKLKRKLKKKIGKVYTKARKFLKLTKKRLVKWYKRTVKKAALYAKKTVQKAKQYYQKAKTQAKQAAVKASKQTTKETVVKTKPKTENPLVKTYNSLKEIGKDFKDGLDTRWNKALDSPYDFANYLTLGALDGLVSGAKDRQKKMWNSPSDFANYATFGFTGMVNGAVNPKDPLSKEHLLDSFGVVTSVFGVKGMKGSTSKTPSGGKTKSAPKENTNSTPEGNTNSTPKGTTNSTPKGTTNSTPKGTTNSTPKGNTNSTPKGNTNSTPKPVQNQNQNLNKDPKKQDETKVAHKDNGVSYGKVFPTREIDMKNEGYILDRATEYKKLVSNTLLKKRGGGNFGYAEVNISGLDTKEFYAHSKIDATHGNPNYEGFSVKPTEDKIKFSATNAPNEVGDVFLRDMDTEYKILNDIADKLGHNPDASGKIKLFTELDTCGSCSRVINAFSKEYPNIDIEIIHNNGQKIKVNK
ncbi:UNVERIFIED_CONTAM: putative deaminase of polymorphic toxin system [Lysinibacillus xylanilyticus]